VCSLKTIVMILAVIQSSSAQRIMDETTCSNKSLGSFTVQLQSFVHLQVILITIFSLVYPSFQLLADSTVPLQCTVDEGNKVLRSRWPSKDLMLKNSYVLYEPARIVLEFRSEVSKKYSEWLDISLAKGCNPSIAQSQHDLTVTYLLSGQIEPCLSPTITEESGEKVVECPFEPAQSEVGTHKEKRANTTGIRLNAALDLAEAEVFGENLKKVDPAASQSISDSRVIILLLLVLLIVVFGQWYWIRLMKRGFLRTTEISRKEGFQIGKRLAQHHSIHPLDQVAETFTVEAAYRILAAKPEWEDEQIRNRYETILRQSHPELLHSKGASSQEIQLARERLHHVHQAYHHIRIFRSR
jgi:hypothetical protein